MPDIGDDRRPKKNPLNANFDKQEFKALWHRINRKAAYSVDFDSDELVQKAVKELDVALRVTPLQYTIQAGEQIDQVTGEALKRGEGFKVAETKTEYNKQSIHSAVKYDLIGKLAEGTQLTRRTVAEILKGSCDLQTFVPKFSTDDLSCCGILGSLCVVQRSDGRFTCCWCEPSRQCLIPHLRIPMPQPVHVAQRPLHNRSD